MACLLIVGGTPALWGDVPREFLQEYCFDCHDGASAKGGLNLEELGFSPDDPGNLGRWVLIHDRVRSGEMPPKDKERGDPGLFLEALGETLRGADRARRTTRGRSTVRRLNRREFEHTLQELLDAPWLQVVDRLPEERTLGHFDKSGESLDVSHVQIARFLEVGRDALRAAVNSAAHRPATRRYHIREEPAALSYLWYRPLQRSATRAAVPLIGTTPQLGVIRKTEPVTVGAADPELRDREALGFFSGTFAATTKYDFTRMSIPIDGRYRLRMKSYTFRAGLNGASGGDDNGLTGGDVKWWRPNRTVAHAGNRSEPVTLYALSPGGDSRWLTTYDAQPEVGVVEREVVLKQGEGIRPDASRLVRTRPGWRGNPNADAQEGIPGLAICWLEVEGPLTEEWPPRSYQAVFGDLPFEIDEQGAVRVRSERPDHDARRLIERFARRAWRQEGAIDPYVGVYAKARELGEDFTEAVLSALSAMLCAPEFLYFEVQPGPLQARQLADRLAYFLHEAPPEEELRELDLTASAIRRKATERLLNDPRVERFVDAFLDHWLDLRDLNANAPDAELYPEYYLDDLLTESSLLETRRYFRELLDQDLPARFLVDSDFAFLNERLANHYGLPPVEGVALRRVALPPGSPRGGLMTQASVLRVTANGTTTSPVIRGAWVMERLVGLKIPPPPSGVAAVEPDTRGATTIREQLDKHTEHRSCAACHERFDPAGFALESFDIAGGWRDRYRALDGSGRIPPVEGIGKNGHLFKFHLAKPVDSSGVLADGRPFADVVEFKRLLLGEERQIARNLVHHLILFSTGAPVSFLDREEVEAILDRAAPGGYGVRTLIHELVQSDLFAIK